MSKSAPLTKTDGSVRQLTRADIASFGGVETLAPALRRKLGVRGPQKSPTKVRITIRLSRDVVDRFRATGDGWQARVDQVLQEWLRREPARERRSPRSR